MNNPLKAFLNTHVKPTTKENEYTPKNGICDAYRKERFTNYNVELMQQIRVAKLNKI